MVDDNKRPAGTQSVCRALDLLTQLAGCRSPAGVTELAGALGLHLSTVSRLLGALQAYGLVVQDPQTDRFQLGPRCLQLGQVFISQTEVARVAEPFMYALTEQTGQQSHLAVLSDGRVVHLKHVEPEGYILRMSAAERYALGDVHAEALGKVLLAFQPDHVVQRVVESLTFRRFTARTIASKERMLKEVEGVRRRGYGIDNGERCDDVRCVAVPIWDHAEQIAAALSVSGSERQIPPARVSKLAATLKETADGVSRRLGAALAPRG